MRGKICKGKSYVHRLVLQGLSYRKQFANHEPTKLHGGQITLSSFDLPPESETTSTEVRHWQRPTAALAEASLLKKFNAKDSPSNQAEENRMQSIIKQLPSEFVPATEHETQQEVGYGIYLPSIKINRRRIITYFRQATHLVNLVLFILWLCYLPGNFMTRFVASCVATVAVGKMLKASRNEVAS